MRIKKQLTSNIMMVRPENFGFNAETATNNSFQSGSTDLSVEEIAIQAKVEFDLFVDKLKKVGIHVYVMTDSPEPIKPDAVFPNNWISMHADASIIQYPMFAKVRRGERNQSFIESLERDFEILEKIDLTKFELKDIFLEGTGSMIFDHSNRLVYACLSVRTDRQLFERLAQRIAYKPISFTSVDRNNIPIYHTNVMMAIGDQFVILCLETIKDKVERKLLVEQILRTGKEIIEISQIQMERFAGNMIQLQNDDANSFLIMSDQAFKSLNPDQIMRIEKYSSILSSPLYTIEKFGGGSARCMIAEIFLPTKQ